MQSQIDNIRDILDSRNDVPEELLIDVPDETEVVAENEAEAPEVEEGASVDDDSVQASDSDDANDAGEVEPYSVASFAEATGLDVSDIYDIEVPTGVNDESVPLGKLKHEMQDAIRERDSMQAQIADMEGKLQNAQSGMQAGQQVSNEVMQAQAQKEAIVLQYQQVNWEELEKSNPGEAALHRQKFQTAFNQAEGAIQQAHDQQEQMRQQGLQSAFKQMHEMIPEWNDQAVMDADHAKIRTAMQGAGYPDEMINHVSDPRALTIWRELVMLREEKAAATGAIQKVRKAPKVLKGAARIPTKKSVDFSALKKGVQNAKPGDRRKAEFDAVKQLLSGNVG